MGLQGVLLQGRHIVERQTGLACTRRRHRPMDRQFLRQVQGQLLRQRLRAHARPDALPQGLQRAIGLQLRLVHACTRIPQRQLFLDLPCPAPVAYPGHAMAQFSPGLRHRQDVAAVGQGLAGRHRIDPAPVHIQAQCGHLLTHGSHLDFAHAGPDPGRLVLQRQAHSALQREAARLGGRGGLLRLWHVFLFPAQQVRMASRKLAHRMVGFLPAQRGLRPDSRHHACQQYGARGPGTQGSLQKRIHVDFLKQTITASIRLGGERTHLWREVQEMGGLVSGANVWPAGAMGTPGGSGWTWATGTDWGHASRLALWWHTPQS